MCFIVIKSNDKGVECVGTDLETQGHNVKRKAFKKTNISL